MKEGDKSDYETRHVDYSLIHGESKAIFGKFTRALHLTNGSSLLDVGGGYGSVLVNILENQPDLVFHYHLLDSSLKQIKRAEKNITAYLKESGRKAEVSFFHQNALKMDLPKNFYDVVVCKMFIHEVPSHKKEQAFKKIFSVIKPGGAVVFWTPDLSAAEHDFYKNTIRKKDELAKYDLLVKNRHFLLNSDLVDHLAKAGFCSAEKLFDFNYDMHTSLRLKSEFNNKKEKLIEWHKYIHEISQLLTPEQKSEMVRDVREDNIHIRFKRAVFKALKP